MDTKICYQCKRELPADSYHFSNSKVRKDGLFSTCKECLGQRFTIEKQQSLLLALSGFKTCAKCGETLPLNDEFFLKTKHGFFGFDARCKKCNATKTHDYYIKNKEKLNSYRQKHYNDNRKYYNDYKNQQSKHRIKTDIKFNIDCRMSTGIYHALKGNKKGRKWESLVGYTLADLIQRLKKTMPNGYTWAGVLNGNLHIHHIKAKVHFKYTDPSQASFKACWALDNLMLLNGKENLSRGAKVETPFQLLLAI